MRNLSATRAAAGYFGHVTSKNREGKYSDFGGFNPCYVKPLWRDPFGNISVIGRMDIFGKERKLSARYFPTDVTFALLCRAGKWSKLLNPSWRNRARLCYWSREKSIEFKNLPNLPHQLGREPLLKGASDWSLYLKRISPEIHKKAERLLDLKWWYRRKFLHSTIPTGMRQRHVVTALPDDTEERRKGTYDHSSFQEAGVSVRHYSHAENQRKRRDVEEAAALWPSPE